MVEGNGWYLWWKAKAETETKKLGKPPNLAWYALVTDTASTWSSIPFPWEKDLDSVGQILLLWHLFCIIFCLKQVHAVRMPSRTRRHGVVCMVVFAKLKNDATNAVMHARARTIASSLLPYVRASEFINFLLRSSFQRRCVFSLFLS